LGRAALRIVTLEVMIAIVSTGIALGAGTGGASRRRFRPKSYASVCAGGCQ